MCGSLFILNVSTSLSFGYLFEHDIGYVAASFSSLLWHRLPFKSEECMKTLFLLQLLQGQLTERTIVLSSSYWALFMKPEGLLMHILKTLEVSKSISIAVKQEPWYSLNVLLCKGAAAPTRWFVSDSFASTELWCPPFATFTVSVIIASVKRGTTLHL